MSSIQTLRRNISMWFVAAAVVAAGWLSGGAARAQSTYFWNLDAAGTWDTTTANWLSGGVPAMYVSNPQNTAVFGGAITASRAIAVATGGVTAGTIRFEDLSNLVYTIGTAGNTITLDNGAAPAMIVLQNSVRGAQTISNSPIAFTTDLTIDNNGMAGANTSLTISSAINRSVAGAGVFTFSGQGLTTISGAIGATAGNITGGLVKNGTGTLTLSSATNNYSGGITINGGVLSVSADGHLGNTANGIMLNAGGTIRFTTATTLNAARVITVNGSGTNPSGIDLGAALTQNIAASQLSGAGTLLISQTGTTSQTTLAITAANNGFVGDMIVGTPGIRLVGSVVTPRQFGSTINTTLLLNNTGSLSPATVTVNNSGAITVTQTTTPTLNRLGTAPLAFNNSRFAYNTAAAAAAINDTFGTVSVTGNWVINGSSAAGPAAGTTLNFGNLTRIDNATLTFQGPATGTGSFGGAPSTGVRYFFANLTPETVTSGTTRSIVPWAGNSLTTGSTFPQNFMTYDANGFRPLNTSTEVVTLAAANTLAAAGAGTNVRATGSGLTQTVAVGGQTVNSFSSNLAQTLQGTATAGSPGDILTVTSGGMAQNGTITATNITFNFPNGAYFHNGDQFNLTTNSRFTGSNGIVVSGISSSYSIAMTNTPTGGNTFTGGLFMNSSGRVTFQLNNQLGKDGSGFDAGALSFGGGQLLFSPASATTVSLSDSGNNRSINVNASNGTIGTTVAGAVLQIPGTISGAGQMQFGGGTTTSATGVVQLTNSAANTYTGGTVVSTGTLNFSNPNQLGTGSVFLNGGVLQAAAPMNFNLPVTVSSASTIDTGANAVTISTPFNNAGAVVNVTKSGAGTLTFNNVGNFYGGFVMPNASGTITINGNGKLNDLGTVQIGAGSAFNVDDSGTSVSNRTGRGTGISFTNSVATTGGGSMTLTTNAAGSSFRFGVVAVTGGTAGNVNSSTITIADGGSGNNTVLFQSLTTVAANNQLNFVGSTNFGITTMVGGSRIFFQTAPTLTGGVIPNATFAGFGGSGQATYNANQGVILFVPPMISGNLIDNIILSDANATNPVPVATNAIFTANANYPGLVNPSALARTGAQINSLILNGADLTLQNAYAAQAGNGNTADGTLLIGSSLTSQGGARTIFNEALTNPTLSFGAANAVLNMTSDLTIVAPITLAGTGGLTKNGAGTLTIQGTYNVTGTVTMNNGTLNLPAAVTTLNGLTYNGGTLNAAGLTTINTNGLTVNAALSLPTVTTVAGGITVNAQTTLAAATSVTGNATVNNTLTLPSASITLTNLAGNATGSVDVGAGILTVSSTADTIYSGGLTTAALVKTGANKLTLNAAQTYAGTTTVNQGTLAAGIGNAIPSGTALIIGQSASSVNGLFDTGGFSHSISGLMIFAQNSGLNPVLAVGTGTTTLTGDINLVDTVASAGNRFGASITAGAGGTLNLGGAVRNITIAGQNNGSALNGGDFRIDVIVTNGGINFTGNLSTSTGNPATAMTLNASAANTYAGGTTVNAGTLHVASTTNLGTGGALINQAGTVLSAISINSSMSLTSLETGTVAAPASAQFVINGAGSALTVNQAATTTFVGVISGAGSLVKTGAGNLILTGANTYGAGTQVNGGRLSVNNTTGSGTGTGLVTVGGGTLGGNGTISGGVLLNTGTVAPGNSTAILNVAGGITFAGGTFEAELDGLTAGMGPGGYDQLNVTSGAISLGTMTNLSLVINAGLTPTMTDFFVIINSGGGTLSGAFANFPTDGQIVASNVNMQGIDYRIWYGTYAGFPNSVVISPVPEPATVLGICAVGFGAVGLIRRRFKKTTIAV